MTQVELLARLQHIRDVAVDLGNVYVTGELDTLIEDVEEG